MMTIKPEYDVAIIGGGHNGLVAACYLAKAGLSVLVLERDTELGGATRSERIFAGVDAKLSIYSYLVSLFPQKIVADLGLDLQLRSRRTASWTPRLHGGGLRELLLRNGAPEANREAFRRLTGDDRDWRGYLELQAMQQQVADVVWPSLTAPMVSREAMRERMGKAGQEAWQTLIEQPLGEGIEGLIRDDLIRGLVFTDAKIGISTYPHDPSLLQNRCFLYHIIGRGSGEWHVPVGGMGALVDELVRAARATGNVTFATGATVRQLDPGTRRSTLGFALDGDDGREHVVDARFVLCNASAEVLDRLLGERGHPRMPSIEGAGFKINMLLERLPRLRSDRHTPADAFAGTVHIDEGYEQMLASYRESMGGQLPAKPPGEIYCHTLSDDSILGDELNRRGFHTLTLFGLDLPYRLFEQDNPGVRDEVVARFLAGINQFLAEPIEDCLASDASGAACLEAMSPVDLEAKIHLPKGNIFHGDLSWPFVEAAEEAGQWGVECGHPSIFLCGSSARRGGCVSGIPGHNAAMKVLEIMGSEGRGAAG